MNRIDLVIDTADSEYGRNLGIALALEDSLFSVSPNDNSELQNCSLFITDKRENAENRVKKGLPCLYLSRSLQDDPACPAVFLYSGTKKIAESIYNCLESSLNCSINRLSVRKSKFICMVSAAGGVGCSAISVALGKELAMSFGGQVLYISFESVASTGLYFNDLGGKATLNEYIYYCFNDKRSGSTPIIDRFLIDDMQGMKAFRPGGHNQLLDLSKEELARLLNRLTFSGDFDYIIMDMKGDMPGISKELLDSCDAVVLVDDGGPVSLYKNKLWLEEHQPDPGKVLLVSNKWDSNFVEETEAEDQNFLKKLYIEADPSCFREIEGVVHINISSRFGLGIRRLADELAGTL